MFSEQNLHKYGTPLPLLELDQVPPKKAVYVQDQIATDDQGRRRFHGAFTGGFSAGYWNTVGSKEGWAPQSFKSSRREKAPEKVSQRPEDFMDDEDRSEFGIAPKGLKINEDFTSATEQTEIRKRKFFQNDLQPIPGEPVLRQLIKPIKDKAAVRILKSWGWRPGQGIGPRQTRKEKKKAKERNKKEMYLIEKYGCEIPTSSSKTLLNSDDESDDTDVTDNEEDEITFAPEDCELPSYHSKKDKYGIGYEPLSRHSVLGSSLPVQQTEHINLFPSLEAVGKNNQKISFSGQAFGVGALEDDDDEDVYALDDITRYDFTLEDKKSNKMKKRISDLDDLLFGEFKLDRSPPKLPIYKVQIPFGWHPRNWNEKRSRFEPLDPKKQKQLEKIFPNASSETNMTREKRAELLGEELRNTQPPNTNTNTKQLKNKTVEELQQEHKERKEKTKSLIEKITAKSSSFTKGGIINIEGEETPTHSEVICSNFKPFAMNEKKQERYEKFLTKDFKNEGEIEEFLNTIQPIELSAWDRQMELKEFQQAKKLYKPLQGIMSDRFITESEIKAVETNIKKTENKQIVVERTKQMWKPHSLLCKRYNIAEPYRGLMEDEKKIKSKQKKLSVFDYIETSVNKKEDFQTPVIVPKNIEKPKQLVQQNHASYVAAIDEEKAKESTTLEWEEVLNPSEKSVKEKKGFTFKPKTELERRVVESINKPLTEKKELFKAIFSDSESEEDIENENNKKDNEEIILGLSKPLNAAAANVLRNNSPPRGIFKSLFTTNVVTLNNDNVTEKETTTNEPLIKDTNATSTETSKVLFQPTFARQSKIAEKHSDQSEVYGPALPQSPPKPSKSSIDKKLLVLFNKHKTKLETAETWVEKNCDMDANNTHNTSGSETSELSSSASRASVKLKKKSKKSKKKNALEHNHRKHKDKKHSKKKKKHKKK